MRKDIKGVLKEAMLNHQLVATYLDSSNMSLCLVGYVDAIDNTKVRFRALSFAGKKAGYEIRSLKEIYRVDVDTFYLRKIDFLQKNRGQIFSEIDLIQPAENSDILFSTLREAKDKRVIVILWTEDKDESIVGYVESLTPQTVQILSIDDYAREDGFVVININEIVSADCNTRNEQILRFLHDKGFGN
ncbi:MAG: hypothetical protein DRR16_27695 [Candidatus Parabeggiatoa sp. nov. 3]|nr:MAG: hypothetical protein DRR00_23850 [Gammaproteobacteria bacterium]RKZ61439.1 MAG: hypothetical protein DRQ99_20440 [Gammaproteobacteria bacterium]RKZ78429.1 MAG: hypothetical protein DRR16_27695 [Gammaproteobacteria bacterium]HEW97544.1 hypothetical protein [Beggiatoa sp.]